MVSSFVPEIVTEMAKCLEKGKEFMLVQLLNRGNKQIPDYTPPQGTDGINISATYLTEEIVHKTHALNKTIGVWLSRSASKENEEMYEKCFRLGVDFVYFDAPVPAMIYRDSNSSNF